MKLIDTAAFIERLNKEIKDRPDLAAGLTMAGMLMNIQPSVNPTDDLKKALYVLLHDTSDATDLELRADDETYVEYIVSALVEKNDRTCPFKNYDCLGSCGSTTTKCERGLEFNCDVDPEEAWYSFIGIANPNGTSDYQKDCERTGL